MPVITLLTKGKEAKFIPKSGWFFWLTWLIFGIIILGTIFSLSYKKSLQQKISIIDKELQSLKSKEEIAKVKEIKDFHGQLKNLKTILNNHVYSSKIIELIEKFTHPKIYWTNLNLLTEKSILTLSGRTASFSDLANQIASLQNNEKIKKLDLSGISINKDNIIDFNLSLELK